MTTASFEIHVELECDLVNPALTLRRDNYQFTLSNRLGRNTPSGGIFYFPNSFKENDVGKIGLLLISSNVTENGPNQCLKSSSN